MVEEEAAVAELRSQPAGSNAPVKGRSPSAIAVVVQAEAEVAGAVVVAVLVQPIHSQNSLAVLKRWRSCSVRAVHPPTPDAVAALVKSINACPHSPAEVVAEAEVAGSAAALVHSFRLVIISSR